MKTEAEKETYHLEVEQDRLHFNKLALALTRDWEAELPAATNTSILAFFPTLYQDCAALVDRFVAYDPEQGIEMTEDGYIPCT